MYARRSVGLHASSASLLALSVCISSVSLSTRRRWTNDWLDGERCRVCPISLAPQSARQLPRHLAPLLVAAGRRGEWTRRSGSTPDIDACLNQSAAAAAERSRLEIAPRRTDHQRVGRERGQGQRDGWKDAREREWNTRMRAALTQWGARDCKTRGDQPPPNRARLHSHWRDYLHHSGGSISEITTWRQTIV
jgi:hypothetical protein